MSYTTKSSIFRYDFEKATISFYINTFAEARRVKNIDERIDSEVFSIGASQFCVAVYPSEY